MIGDGRGAQSGCKLKDGEGARFPRLLRPRTGAMTFPRRGGPYCDHLDSEQGGHVTSNDAAADAPNRTTARTEKRSRWMALVVLCVGMLMIVLDVTVVNVALPSIQSDLGFSQSALAWVVNAYLIAFGGLLLLAGRFGDLLGRRRVFMSGLIVFTAASLLCGVAQSQELLVAARFVQGIGGAMTSAVILGMIVTMFPEPRDQAKALGVYAFVRGRLDRSARRWRADAGDQLALDLLHQRPNRSGHRAAGAAADRQRSRHRAGAGC
jgi:hypothetical protein